MSAAEGRLWGGVFSQAPDRAAFELGRSVAFDVRLWPYDLAGSRAHADELRRIGVLDEEAHARVVHALALVEGELERGEFAFRDDDEDLHGALERRLVEIAGDDGARLRAGRSRNDQIANDLRLYLRDAVDRLAALIAEVQAELVGQAERHAATLAPGYTHLQRAQPVSLGHHLLAHAWPLDRDRGRLADARARIQESSPLGAGALAGATLPLDPARYAEALGYAGVAANSMDAVADRDVAVEVLAACALLGVHLSRLCEEVVLWASEEFRWARVGEAFSTGSSIMPQKRNPDVAELVRGKTGRLVGALVSLLVTLKGLPLTYNRDLQEDKEPLFDAVDTLDLALPAVAGMVASLEFDRERLAATAAGGFALATDLAEALVGEGVTFRRAHERVGGLVAACERAGHDDLDPALAAEALPELGPARIAELLDPAAALSRRSASLGPSEHAVRAQITRLRERL